jgi:heme/copper-type cytochrome/quinol oxidase subunit 1
MAIYWMGFAMFAWLAYSKSNKPDRNARDRFGAVIFWIMAIGGIYAFLVISFVAVRSGLVRSVINSV